MKYLHKTIGLSFFVALNAYAGGSIGGVGPSVALEESMMNAAFRLESLPKAYVDQDEFRRASARLSILGVETAAVNLHGELIQVRKLLNSIVNAKVSKEISPKAP